MTVSLSPHLPLAAPRPGLARLQRVERGLVLLWFIVTFTVFRNDELLLYPLALYFTVATLRDRHVTLPLLLRCWPLALLPVWAMFTAPLAVVPAEALRGAVQMQLTVVISVLIAAWMSPREVLLTALAATGFAGVLSLFITSYHDGAMTGIFAHKNMLGAKMLLLWTAALCVALDGWVRLWLRLLAAALAGLALMLILASQSATALVLAVLVLGLVMGFVFLWGRGADAPPDRLALGLILAGLLTGAIATGLALTALSPFELLLGALGKSTTLTGRTELWAYAGDVIAQRPVAGHGARGFWRYEENELVRRIFEEFHKSPKQVFSFHNSFYEIGVHHGLVGIGLTVLMLVWAVGRLLAQLVRRGGMPFVFLMVVTMVELIRAMVESELTRPFVLAHMLIWIGAVYASKHPLKR
ncbi:O-antigen ligase family protein [Limimaricola pyoseonensis]|uniref:Exopolysaccharide production protein ExoQ n=1 Tax=Limimaricola pyoseonensis TaxID=521013 RepID=A0A1G7IZS8_9RHOB|nr:O-antigen ligase family protein [Limimaricola pyoseonensis]SDF18064.1 exopolysaccharide production protein ExoQ [Limimaricola pyoseonensis]